MITKLASPSVCLIDEDPNDYGPILDALVRLGVGCLHIKGDDTDNLPPQPFSGLRLIFMDLHLRQGPLGKASAAHAANVFSKVVSINSLPSVVVIWSKYKDDKPMEDDLPPDDQPTEAEIFKQMLLDNVPEFREKLVFTEMPKPKDRPTEEEAFAQWKIQWTSELLTHIKNTVADLDGFDILWTWESLVRDAGVKVNNALAEIVLTSTSTDPHTHINKLNDALKMLLKSLAQEQGGTDCTRVTAPRHLSSVLAQSLADHLEHSEQLETLDRHGDWLIDKEGITEAKKVIGPSINGLLLTAGLSKQSAPFIPGTVYRLTNEQYFQKLFEQPVSTIIEQIYQGKPSKFEEWKASSRPKVVLVEISPACDVQQQKRRNAMLIAGFILSASDSNRASIKSSPALEQFPVFSLRWPSKDFEKQDAFLVFCSHYKTTINADYEPSWLRPWFRIRELPTASLRNWHSSHSSRVGYLRF